MSRESQHDGWLSTTLRQVPAAATEACLDAETLAAWAEGGLSAQAAAAAEVHASNCSRCMAVLAEMERSAPVAPATDAWTRARVFRWLVPLTAAATAIAIWIAVPDQSITPERPAAVRDLGTANERADAASPQLQAPVEVPVPSPPDRAPARQAPVPEMADLNRAPSPTTPSLESQSAMREELSKAVPPSAAPVPEPAPAPAPQQEAAADAVAGTAQARTRSAKAFSAVPPVESRAPANPQVRWRIVGSASVERSTDGGKTWTSASPVPGVAPDNPALAIVGVRAVDADRAVVRTSDNRELYTSNGGLSWMRVQENSTAPF